MPFYPQPGLLALTPGQNGDEDVALNAGEGRVEEKITPKKSPLKGELKARLPLEPRLQNQGWL